MKSRQQQQVERYTASRRLQAPDPTNLVWEQWGKALVEQYPREEWPARLQQAPKIYQEYLRARLLREYGDEVTL